MAAVFLVAGVGNSSGNRFVAVRAKCPVPGCEVCDSIPGAVLDAGIARGISEQPRAGEMALAVRAESDDRSD